MTDTKIEVDEVEMKRRWLDVVWDSQKDWEFQIWELEYQWVNLRIIKNKFSEMYSVYARKYVDDLDKCWYIAWFCEVSSNHARNLMQAKSVAGKLVDIVLWYNPPKPWREY